ncbi:hypothetical protein NH340_JMT03239 [Sarcoptes scabiei]|nr:hypothetical protein NH340_JMT03239 [Sarcoptes scabiei]
MKFKVKYSLKNYSGRQLVCVVVDAQTFKPNRKNIDSINGSTPGSKFTSTNLEEKSPVVTERNQPSNDSARFCLGFWKIRRFRNRLGRPKTE